MEPTAIIGALAAAIAGLAGFVAFLVKYVLADKDKQIERLLKVAEGNGAIASESLGVAKATKEVLDRIDGELRRERRKVGGGG